MNLKNPHSRRLRMYRAIGHSVVTWAQTELFLNWLLVELIGANEAHAKPFVTTIDASRKIQRAKALALFRFPNHNLKINKIFSDLDSIRADRNKYIHTRWVTIGSVGTGGDANVKGFAQKQEEVNPVLNESEFKISDVILTTRRLRRLNDEASEFFNSLFP